MFAKKAKTFTQRRKGIAKKNFAYSLRLCVMLFLFGSGLSGLGYYDFIRSIRLLFVSGFSGLSRLNLCGYARWVAVLGSLGRVGNESKKRRS
jgi:hypothetical protein